MIPGKRIFLHTFDTFLEQLNNGKCYFKLLDGRVCQGWITDIGETTFEYLDSGPMAREEPYRLAIIDIDTTSFAYWDEEIARWTRYSRPDKLFNRTLKP